MSNIAAVVYTTPTCISCKKAIQWLDQHGVSVSVRDASELNGQFYSVPVIVIADVTHVGFNPKQLERTLRHLERWLGDG